MSSNNDQLPFVSLLIPIKNEDCYLDRCLKSVMRQDYPSDLLEILISDGMSTDNTRLIIKNWEQKDSRISLFDNPQKIVPTGLNILIPITMGDVVIRIDGHCIIDHDYVTNCVRHLQKGEVDGVGGPMRTVGEDFISEVIAAAMSSKFGVGDSSFRTESGQTMLVDTVPFPAYTREIIEKVGLYDEELVRNQDDEYNYRIRGAGGKILLAEDVRSTYFSRGSLSKLWKQYFQYGYWKVRVMQKHPRQMSLRQFVPPTFVLSIIVSIVLALTSTWGWLLLTVIAGLYLVVNFGYSLSIAAKNSWRMLGLLPITFTIIHISYGSGFLTGLIKFANRWNDKAGKVPTLLP